MTVFPFLAGVAASLTIASSAIVAQAVPTVQLSAMPTCARCSIELVRVATLGSAEDSVLLDGLSGAVAVTSRGEFLVPAASGFQIARFDASGRFVGAFGRRGPGPGEFRGINHVRVTRGDSVMVGDARNGVQLFDPRLKLARTIRVPNGTSFYTVLVRPSGELVRQVDRERLVITDPNGEAVDTIRVTPAPGDARCGACNGRALSQSISRDRFWSTISNQYMLELLDLKGVVHQRLVRRPDWFQGWEASPQQEPGGARTAPQPRLYSVRQDSAGLLWALASVPDPKWKSAPGGVSVAAFAGTSDAMLAVIDPLTGTVLAEHRFDEPLGFVGEGEPMIFLMRQDADGIVTIEISRVNLVRRP